MPSGVAYLATLYVTDAARGSGVGSALVKAVLQTAREQGATDLYVSATPTRETVDFYLAQGFVRLATPNPRLIELEPDDIHLQRKL